MKNEKVLIIGDHTIFHTGGVATHVATLASELSMRDYEITIAVLLKNLEEKGHYACVDSKGLKICGSKGFFRHVLTIIRQGKRAGIIHTHNLMSTIVARILFPKKPLVRTVHGYYSLERIARGTLKHNSLKFKTIRKIEMYGIKFPDIIITVDNRIKKWLLGTYRGSDKFKVILNTPPKDTFPKVMTSNRVHKREFVIGYAKALTPKNGPTYLVKGFKRLVEEYGVMARLIIIGDGPLKREIINLSKGLNHMIALKGNLPHKETLRIIAENIDVLVVPSVSIAGVEEASSIVAQEAMYLGVPVIASDIGGLRDIIVNMKNGILIKDKDPTKIAEAILFIWENPKIRKKLSYMGKKSVLKRNMANSIDRIYQQILESKRR